MSRHGYALPRCAGDAHGSEKIAGTKPHAKFQHSSLALIGKDKYHDLSMLLISLNSLQRQRQDKPMSNVFK